MSFTDYDKCSLLLPMNGSNGGTTFTDWSPNGLTLTRGGATLPVTSTASFKYYDSSGLFGANASGIPSHLHFTDAAPIGTGQFTIAGWVKRVDSSSVGTLFDNRSNSGFTGISSLDTAFTLVLSAASGKLRLVYGTGATTLDGTTSFTNGVYEHVALTRDASNVLRGFLNGVKEFESTVSNDFSNPYTCIGGLSTAINSSGQYVQDFIFLKGVALWTADFTPPTRLIGTISGTVHDKDGSVAARSIIAMPRSYPSKQYTTTSSAGDGTYSLTLPATEMSVVGLANESVLREDKIERVIPE